YSSRRRHTRFSRDWSSDVCSSDLRYFDIPFDRVEVQAAIDRAVKGRKDPARIRISIDRDGWVAVETAELPSTVGPPRLVLDDRGSDERRVGEECRCGLQTFEQLRS